MDLLGRRPDAVFEEPGKLTAVRDEGEPQTASFGIAEGSGWDKRTFPRAEDGSALPVEHPGPFFKRNNQPRSQLILRATKPEDRLVRMRLWSVDPAGDEPGSLQVHLNGKLVQGVSLEREPAWVEIETPAALWAFGENLLELVCVQPEGEGRRWDVFALQELEYGPRRLAELSFEEKRAVFSSHTGARYFVDTAPGSLLSLAAEAEAPGELELRFGGMDPADGSRRFEGYPELTFPVTRRGIDVHRPLPDTREELQAIELIWRAEDGASALELTTLEVLEPGENPPPPIVFVSIDTFAARHLGVYGYARKNTPALRKLAADGVVFEHCISNAPWTMPSYLSVLTGLYPRSHVADLDFAADVRLDNWDYWQIADNRWTLAEALRARGYETGGIADTHWLSPKFRVDQGFDRYDISAAFMPIADVRGGIVYQLERLITPWLRELRDRSRPPFLFLHSLDAHGPYLPEPPFRDRFESSLPADRRSTLAGSSYQTYGAIPVWMARTTVLDPDAPIPRKLELEPIIQRYDESIAKVDEYLGKLFALLEAEGLYDDAVIVVTGDHGESFDHEFYSHGGLWEDVIHVPLLLKLPRSEFAGKRVSTSVQLVDVYPTLFELSGAGTPPSFLHGRSLMPLLRGDDPSPLPVFCEGGHVEQYTIIDQGWKLIEVFPGRESGDTPLLTHPRVPEDWLEENFPELVGEPLTDELRASLREQPGYDAKVAELRKRIDGPYYHLYDLNTDPGETRNLYDEKPGQVEWLKALLQAHKLRGLDAQKNAKPGMTGVRFSADALQQLSELGYTDAPVDGDDEEPR